MFGFVPSIFETKLMIVDLLVKFRETLNSDLEIENLQKTKGYMQEYNDLLQEIQKMTPEFQGSDSEHYEAQTEQFNSKNKKLIDSIDQYETFLKDLEQPIQQQQQHLENCKAQIDKLKSDLNGDQQYFDLDIKLFKELGVLTNDNHVVVQQDHLKTFQRIRSTDNPWDYLYEA